MKEEFCNVSLSDLENVLQEIQEQKEPGSAFLEHLEAEILKISPLNVNLGGYVIDNAYQ